MKKTKRLRGRSRRLLSAILALSLTVTSLSYGAGKNTKEADAFALSTIGTVLGMAGSVTGMMSRMDETLSGSTVGKLFDTLFGTNYYEQKKQRKLLEETYKKTEAMELTLEELKKNSKEVNARLNAINGQLSTVNQRLEEQQRTLSQITDTMENVQASQRNVSGQISSLQSALSDQLKETGDSLKVALYGTTEEIKNANTLLQNLNTYYTKFDGLSSSEKTILEDLKSKQEDYEEFMTQVLALSSGEDTRDALGQLSMNLEESYAALTEQEKALLDQQVTVDGQSLTVRKYMFDYMESMHDFMEYSVFNKNSGYTSDMYETVVLMGEYITGEQKTMESMGVGETYYRLSMLNYATNDEVHAAYRGFMDSVLMDYYTTAYLCQLALSYKISYELANDGNSSDISTWKRHLSSLQTQMGKVTAYLRYEETSCIMKYDYNGYVDADIEEYLCYYGNSINAQQGIKNWICRKKQDVYAAGALSDQTMTLALGETRPLHLYYGTREVTEDAVWSCGTEGIVRINDDGTVVAVSEGAVEVTASYGGTEYTCTVTVMPALAVRNGTTTCNYHYTDAEGEDAVYSVEQTETGYDYYYQVDSYLADRVTLSAEKSSVGIAEVTGLTDAELSEFTWMVVSEGVAGTAQNQIYAVDNGQTVVYGYRYLEDELRYEYVGIPVDCTEDTSTALEEETGQTEGKDYSDYEKISTKEDLIALAQDPEKWSQDCKYVLTNDIDLGGMEWEPIGYEILAENDTKGSTLAGVPELKKPFEGVFDGNGYAISNFKITTVPYQEEIAEALKKLETPGDELYGVSVGLFGATRFATITDINVIDAEISLGEDILEEDGTLKVTDSTGETSFSLNVENMVVYAGTLVGRCSSGASAKILSRTCQCYGTASSEGISEEIEGRQIDEETLRRYAGDTEEEVIQAILDCPDSMWMSQFYAVLRVMIYQCAREEARCNMQNCYVDGDISVNLPGRDEDGGNFIGMLAGEMMGGVIGCRAQGTITSVDASGYVGGLAGNWAACDRQVKDCVSQVQIASTGDAAAGGLLGNAELYTAMVIRPEYRLKAEDFDTIIGLKTYEKDDVKITEPLLAAGAMGEADTIYLLLGSVFLDASVNGLTYIYAEDAEINASISGCQVLGNISAEGTAGGLIGAKGQASMLTQNGTTGWSVQYQAASGAAGYPATASSVQSTTYQYVYNLDIADCYIISDVETEGAYAAGVIGSCALSDYEKEKREDMASDEDTTTVNDAQVEVTAHTEYAMQSGSIRNCYYYGKLRANQAAAGITANVKEYDHTEVSQMVIAPTEITVGDGTSDALTGTPTMAESGYVTGDSDTIYYYKGTVYTIRDGNAVQGAAATDLSVGTGKTAAQFNERETYQTLWGDENFLELTGRLDLQEGYLPTYLETRCRFPLEKARRYYTVGDTFEPLQEARVYNGVTVRRVTDGIETEAPDMSTPGIRQVTVRYQDVSDTYTVYVYPQKESMLRVSTLPELQETDDGMTLSGGMVTVYDNQNQETRKVSIEDCGTVWAKDQSYVLIQYGTLSTCLRIVSLEIYSNALEEDAEGAELRKCIYYPEGTKVQAEELLDASVTNAQNKRYKLKGAAQTGEMVLETDQILMTLYEEDDTAEPTDSPQVSVTPQASVLPSATAGISTTAPGQTPQVSVAPAQTPEIEPSAAATTAPGQTGESPAPTEIAGKAGDAAPVQSPETTAGASGKETAAGRPAKGTVLQADEGDASYLVVDSSGSTPEVYYKSCQSEGTTAVRIPDTVKIQNTVYRVTGVADLAFAGAGKLKSVTLGKHVAYIGKKAFYGCKSLRKIKILSKKLNSMNVGKKAFARIAAKPVVKVPKKKAAAYKKLLRKRGVSAAAKFKKL